MNDTMDDDDKVVNRKKGSDSGTPVLDNFSRDLNKFAQQGKLDPVIGREKEILRIAQVLSRRKKNNPIILGEPGCGKSGIIQMISKQIIDKSGIVINIKDEDDLERFSSFVPSLRSIEMERPLIVILEDIDSIAGDNSYSVSKLLNILDGVKQIENVVYIATTNYPEKLQERITNRPSRFDRRYKVDLPGKEIRRSYIKNKLEKSDLDKIDIEEWIERTEGMSLSHLKEVVISVIIMGRSFEETIENLEGLKKSPTIRGSGKVGFGGK